MNQQEFVIGVPYISTYDKKVPEKTPVKKTPLYVRHKITSHEIFKF